MSTVAYDGKVVAADKLASCHGGSFHVVTKIHTIRYRGIDLAVFAFSGDLQDGILAIEWLENQTRPKPTLNAESFVGLLVFPGGKAYRMEEALAMWEIQAPHAIGSGSKFALTCMHLGMDAQEAVRIASELDTYSGGGIDAIDVT